MRLSKNKMTAAVACVLAGTSLASAEMTRSDEFTTVVNFPTPETFYRSLTLFITSQTGDVIEGSFFDSMGFTGVVIGDETSVTSHPAQISFLAEDGQTFGDQLLRFEFPEQNLWEPGETLTFFFTIWLPEDVGRYKIDWQFEVIPTPGAAALAGIGLLASLRRRRAR